MTRLAFFTLLVASVVTLTACAGQNETQNPPASSPAQTTSATLHTFTSDGSGFDTHSFYFDNGQEVVVFDAQFTEALAQKLLDDIRSKTSSKIAYVVITHPNPDKFNGVRVFQNAGAQVVASSATAASISDVHAYKKYYFTQIAGMFTEETYPKEATVDITFDGSMTLDLQGDHDIELTQLQNSGVSSTQTVAYIPQTRALIVGDLVHHKAHAWLEGGIVGSAPKPDLVAWKRALNELNAWSGATVYGGRGEFASVGEAVRMQTEYLEGVETIVQSYLEELGDRTSELQGDSSGEHHKELARRVAQAFPDYALSYMTEYSVYGLLSAMVGQ